MADEQRNLPAPSEKRVPPTPRLSSPRPIQTHGLTSERVAKIVSQSGSARMAALLGVAAIASGLRTRKAQVPVAELATVRQAEYETEPDAEAA